MHSHISLSIHKNTVFVVWIYQAFPAFVPFNLIGNMPLSQMLQHERRIYSVFVGPEITI